MGGLWLEPRDLEGDQEPVAGEAGRGQVMQGLGSHTKNSGFYPEGKSSEQGRDRPRLVFQKEVSVVYRIRRRRKRREQRRL